MLQVEQEGKSPFAPPFPEEAAIAVCPPAFCLLLPCHLGSSSSMLRARQQIRREAFEGVENCSEKQRHVIRAAVTVTLATSQPLLLWTILWASQRSSSRVFPCQPLPVNTVLILRPRHKTREPGARNLSATCGKRAGQLLVCQSGRGWQGLARGYAPAHLLYFPHRQAYGGVEARAGSLAASLLA